MSFAHMHPRQAAPALNNPHAAAPINASQKNKISSPSIAAPSHKSNHMGKQRTIINPVIHMKMMRVT